LKALVLLIGLFTFISYPIVGQENIKLENESSLESFIILHGGGISLNVENQVSYINEVPKRDVIETGSKLKSYAGISYSLRVFLNKSLKLEFRPGLFVTNIATLPSLRLGAYLRQKFGSMLFIGLGMNCDLIANLDQQSNGIGESIGGIFLSPVILTGIELTRNWGIFLEFIPGFSKKIGDVTKRAYYASPIYISRELSYVNYSVRLGLEFSLK